MYTMYTLMPLIPILVLITHIAQVQSHGLMTDPAQRGTLNPRSKLNNKPINKSAPVDYKAHFPAGNKDGAPGAGARSQVRIGKIWTPYTPTLASFRWRAGVCGDEIGKAQEHMRGGKYYNGGQIAKTWVQGSVIQISINVIAHHNGFMEIHVCDVRKCGGEISAACFRQGHCHHLKRAANPSCDSGYDKRCAPIDPKYPHRWYLPCTTKPENTQQRMGGPKMTFRLPRWLTCEHCVVQWFWSAANTCNPPGVVEFFEGKHGPKNWGNCFGQGGARGGYTKVQKDCGGNRFPEEYYQCADVKIVRRAVISTPPATTLPPTTTSTTTLKTSTTTTTTSTTTSTSSTTKPTTSATTSATTTGMTNSITRGRVFKELTLIADGETAETLRNGTVVNITGYEQVTIEAVTNVVVRKIRFYVNGEQVWADYFRPYMMFGNRGSVPNYWDDPVLNRFFRVRVEAGREKMEIAIMFVRLHT